MDYARYEDAKQMYIKALALDGGTDGEHYIPLCEALATAYYRVELILRFRSSNFFP